MPAIKKKNSITGKPILARGKLVDKCRNLLHTFGPVKIEKKRQNEEELNSSVTKKQFDIGII